MASKKKTHGLTLFMLKPIVKKPEDAVENPISTNSVDIELDTKNKIKGKLFFKQLPQKKPTWYSLFESQAGAKFSSIFNAGTSAVLLVERNQVFFATVFGYGRYLLKQDIFEESFGLRFVLNSVDQIRSIDIKTIDAISLDNRSQASVLTDIDEFGVDVEQDLLRAVTGKSQDQAFGKTISGRDSVQLSLPIELADIPQLLNKIIKNYEDTKYQDRFSWVDNLKEVREKLLNKELDSQLVAGVISKELTKVWLAVPEIIEWDRIDGFKYQKEKLGELYDDLDWDEYLRLIDDKDKELSIDILKKQRIYAVDSQTGYSKYKWSVYNCIYSELSYQNDTYVLSSGKWYKVNKDYLIELDSFMSSIDSAKFPFPKYNHKDEATYNKDVCDTGQGKYALMDQKNIDHGSGKSKIEFCDLYSNDGDLICVKKYASGSSTLSHLFSQATVAVELFLQDCEFRKKVNKELPKSHKIKTPLSKPDPKNIKVCYAIISKPDKKIATDLPLFSKINLRTHVKKLQLMGVGVSIMFIEQQN